MMVAQSLRKTKKNYVYKAICPVVTYFCRSRPGQTRGITQFIMDFLWHRLPTLRVLPGPDEFCRLCTLSADDTWLVSSSFDSSTNFYLSLWHVESGNRRWRVSAHTDQVTELVLTSDNQYICSASWDHSIKIWSFLTGELRHILQHNDMVSGCSLSADNRSLVSASYDRFVRVWVVQTGRRIKMYDKHGTGVRWAQFCTHDQHIIAAGRTVCVWNVTTGAHVQKLGGHTNGISSCTLSENKQFLLSVSGDDERIAKVWTLATGTCIQTFQNKNSTRTGCFMSENKYIALINIEYSTLGIWRVSDGQCVRRLPNVRSISPHSYWLSGRNIECIMVSTKEDVQVLAVESSESIFTAKGYGGAEFQHSVCISSDGRYLISGFRYKIKIFVFSENKQRRNIL